MNICTPYVDVTDKDIEQMFKDGSLLITEGKGHYRLHAIDGDSKSLLHVSTDKDSVMKIIKGLVNIHKRNRLRAGL
jgi:uncharacterized protein YwgA